MLRGSGCAIRDTRTCSPLRPLDPDVKLVDSTRLQRIREGPERRAATLAERGIDGVNLHHSDWNGGLVTLFHRFKRTAFGWDMQHEHILRPALRMGLDGVFSDHVDVMVDAYRAELGTLCRRPSKRLTPPDDALQPLPVGLSGPEHDERAADEVVTRGSARARGCRTSPARLSPITNTESSGTDVGP